MDRKITHKKSAECKHYGRKKDIFLLSVVLFFLLTPQKYCADNLDTLKRGKSGWANDMRVISIGFGPQNSEFGNFGGPLKSTEIYNISSISSSAVFHGKLEFFLNKHFGIGANVNYSTLSYYYSFLNYATNQEKVFPINLQTFNLNVRVNYHLFYLKELDVYLGAGTGLRLVKKNLLIDDEPTNNKSGFLREYETSLGVRYLANGLLGAYLEIGLSRSLIQFGLSLNIKTY